MRQQGKRAPAAEHYELAADAFAAAGMRCNQAQALNMAALPVAENGQYDHADCLLEIAKKLASCCGAWRLYDEAEKLLLDLVRSRAAERQLAQCTARLYSELTIEDLPRWLVDAEAVRLAFRAIERQHQLPTGAGSARRGPRGRPSPGAAGDGCDAAPRPHAPARATRCP